MNINVRLLVDFPIPRQYACTSSTLVTIETDSYRCRKVFIISFVRPVWVGIFSVNVDLAVKRPTQVPGPGPALCQNDPFTYKSVTSQKMLRIIVSNYDTLKQYPRERMCNNKALSIKHFSNKSIWKSYILGSTYCYNIVPAFNILMRA